MIGQRIGPFAVVAKLGEGGMGEVYRATDTTLGRDVAIKVLPQGLIADPDRMVRFEREARMLASLNHPNIAAIHGVEASSGTRALVLELVDGLTLAERIAARPMPVAEALAIARQIADALEAAHEKGIVHRDLKPQNIKVAPGDRVKVLDFGLAIVALPPAIDSSHSPTMTAGATRDGALVGTIAYMSPEQLRALPVDRRADIWAFGCLLFEMLTGRHPFAAATGSDRIASILSTDPDWTALPPQTPPAIRRLLRRCLEKDADRRLRDIADGRLELDERAEPAAAPAASTNTIRRYQLALAAVLVAAIGWALWANRAQPASTPIGAIRFVVQPAGGGQMGGRLGISPDGQTLVSAVTDAKGERRLFARRFDQLEAVALPGTENGVTPFFSPDGQWMGFVTTRPTPQLKKLRFDGTGSSSVVYEGGGVLGASWVDNGTILLSLINNGVQRIPVAGGRPEPLVPLEASGEVDHHDPFLLPGGRAILLNSHRTGNQFRVDAVELATGKRTTVVADGFAARYLASGQIVYARGQALFAQPFDVDRLAVTGAPVKVVENVSTVPESGWANFAVSATGVLTYAPSRSIDGRRLVWVDRSGTETALPIGPRAFSTPRLAPDDEHVAVTVADGGSQDIWVLDVRSEAFTRATFDGARSPAWTRDGRLTYTISRGASQQLMVQQAAGSVSQPVIASDHSLFASTWSPGDRTLLYVDALPTDVSDIRAAPVLQGTAPRIVVPPNVHSPTLSPDGRWLAYAIDTFPRSDIAVQPFPDGPRRQITADGGTDVLWSRNGREIFFLSQGAVYAISVDAGERLVTGKPVRLFAGSYRLGFKVPEYDVTRDGQRFLMVKPSDDELAPAHAIVVLNWGSEVRSRFAGSGGR